MEARGRHADSNSWGAAEWSAWGGFPRPRVTEMKSIHSGEDLEVQVIPPTHTPASNVIPSTVLNPGLFVRFVRLKPANRKDLRIAWDLLAERLVFSQPTEGSPA